MNSTIGQRSNWRSALGQLLRGIVAVLVALLMARSWLLEPFVVPSGSMAPTLLGLHAELTCRQCGYRFAYGLDDGPARRVLCPNCGHVQIEDADPPALDGDRVLVDRSAFRVRNPRRWEPAAFRSPSRARDIAVKRVVGLPGETIEILDGDVYANGRIQRKSLAEQRALAIPVYDSTWEEQASGAAKRWQPDDAASRWKLAGGRFIGTDPQATAVGSKIDWLSYHHLHPKPGSSTITIRAPVTDGCGYNQTQSRRELYPVHDLAFRCRLRATNCGQILVEAYDSGATFSVRLDLRSDHQRIELWRDEMRLTEVPCAFQGASTEARLYVSLIDQQVCVAWNDEPLILWPYERSELERLAHAAAQQPQFRGPEDPAPAASRPFRIAAQGGGLEIWDLRIERDVYYTPHPTGPAGGPIAATRLGSDEYFVLGDNSPQSRDSRLSDFGPGVPKGLLVGKPIVVYFPARLMGAWGWSFQVPEFSNIRYIR